MKTFAIAILVAMILGFCFLFDSAKQKTFAAKTEAKTMRSTVLSLRVKVDVLKNRNKKLKTQIRMIQEFMRNHFGDPKAAEREKLVRLQLERCLTNDF